MLEYLVDITDEDLDEDEGECGFRLTFHFAKNPFFSNETLVRACALFVSCAASSYLRLTWFDGFQHALHSSTTPACLP